MIPKLIMLAAGALAQPNPVHLDPVAVELWADSLISPALATSGVPGALLVVVNRAGVILNEAYGLADVATGRRASADSTLFEYASIGKTMTAVIASQLIDEGVLDPDQDINRYLTSAQVSGPKVTLRMLLAHRGGFDDDITGLLAPFDGDIRMSQGELERRFHPLVAPGYATAYDNQGYGVVGLILRDVTRKSIPDLYRERLFRPAGMTNAIHGRPADGMTRLAHCYTVRGPGAIEECPLWLYREGLMGAGGVAATGADMAVYLRMLLGGGTVDGRTVLTPKAFADLTNWDHFRFHPGMPGGGHAFSQFEEFRGLEYAHSGSIPGFSSMMKIYADRDLAILFTFLGGQPPGFDLTVSNVVRSLRQANLRDEARPGITALQELTDTFGARFIPANRPRSSEGTGVASAAATERLDDYLGHYVSATNHSRSFVARLGGWGGLLTLERAGTDGVRLGGLGELGDYRRVGPLLYENPKGDRLALAGLPVGRYLAIGLSGGVFRKTTWIESPGWSMPMFAVGFLLLLSGAVALRPKAPNVLRRLAARSLIGLSLVVAGLLAEWQWGVTLGVVRGSIVLPLVWRLALLVGAGMLLAETARFLRSRSAESGRLGYGHGVLLGAASIAVVAALVVWRVLGAFPPYFSY